MGRRARLEAIEKRKSSMFVGSRTQMSLLLKHRVTLEYAILVPGPVWGVR
jgi:hypothetical protein